MFLFLKKKNFPINSCKDFTTFLPCQSVILHSIRSLKWILCIQTIEVCYRWGILLRTKKQKLAKKKTKNNNIKHFSKVKKKCEEKLQRTTEIGNDGQHGPLRIKMMHVHVVHMYSHLFHSEHPPVPLMNNEIQMNVRNVAGRMWTEV